MIYVFDDVMSWPVEYRDRALQRPFGTFLSVHGQSFHGIAACDNGAFAFWMTDTFKGLAPSLTFFRRSPLGQVEPNFRHDDADMGDWAAVLYLTPDPPPNDGTVFYDDAESVNGFLRIPAKFNRAVVYPASLQHSRAIRENYGHGDTSRLIQMMFGTGTLPHAAEKGVTWA